MIRRSSFASITKSSWLFLGNVSALAVMAACGEATESGPEGSQSNIVAPTTSTTASATATGASSAPVAPATSGTATNPTTSSVAPSTTAAPTGPTGGTGSTGGTASTAPTTTGSTTSNTESTTPPTDSSGNTSTQPNDSTSQPDDTTSQPQETSEPEPTETCDFKPPFRWTSTGPLAEPKGNGWHSLKDFSVTKYNGKYLVYATVNDGNWNGFFSVFDSFDKWKDADQSYHSGHVAPQIFYFTPKDTWVLVTQWSIRYRTSKTPTDFNSWSPLQSMMAGDPTGGRGTGPIDPAVICDDKNCYLFFNDDAGGVYRGSMPIGDFPGEFKNVTRILDDRSVIFEGIQVYSVKGHNKYLMIIENNGTRAFRAWEATDLGGTWTPMQGANSTQSPFAGEANVTWPGGKWTNDISHGDLVRENPSEKMEIDPCNLQLLYQGRNPNVQAEYGSLPYRPGLLTLQR